MNNINLSVGAGSVTGAAIALAYTKFRKRKIKADLKKKHPDWNEKKIKDYIIKRYIISGLAGAGAGAALGYGVHKGATITLDKYHKFVGKKSKQNIDLSKFHKGDIISYDRGGYQHYGVVVDDKGNTIEYKRHDEANPQKASVIKTNIKDSAGISNVKVEKNRSNKYTPDEIVARAEKYVGSNLGGYNLANNNCEHFVRYVAEGKKDSTQVNNFRNKNDLTKLIIDRSRSNYAKRRTFSEKGFGGHIGDTLTSIAVSNGFDARKSIKDKKLGGLSHFNKYQTTYLTTGGALVGGAIGAYKGKKAFREAVKKYKLKPGTLQYKLAKDKYLKGNIVKGAAIGAGAGALSSLAKDSVVGKVVKDKIKYGHGVNLGNSYRKIGRSFRGIKSEKQINDMAGRWKQLYQWQKDSLI